MKMFLIALKTLRRKKVRSVLTIGGVAIAVGVLVGLLGFDKGYQQALRRDIDKMGYQVLVTAKGCPYEAATLMLKGGGGLRYMDQKVYEKIVSDQRIEQITPQLVATIYSEEQEEGRSGISMYMGVMKSYLDLKPWIKFRSGGWFSGETADEAVMGYEVAELEQRVVGDEIFIPKIGKVLKVVGIMERTGTQDDGIIFMPLKTAQTVFSLDNKITGIGIKLKDLNQIQAFEEDLYDEPGIQVVSMAQVRGTILNLMSSAKVMANSIASVAIIIAVIGVMNTILMSVFERTKQIGVMKALGASKTDIFKIIWMETTLTCVIGGVIGSAAAVLGGNVMEKIIKKILPYAPSGQLIVISFSLIGVALVGTVLIGLLAGIYPAFRAASMRPVEAIRSSE